MGPKRPPPPQKDVETPKKRFGNICSIVTGAADNRERQVDKG
jgi:hypothetical protein